MEDLNKKLRKHGFIDTEDGVEDPLMFASSLHDYRYIKMLLDAGFEISPSPRYCNHLLSKLCACSCESIEQKDIDYMDLLLKSNDLIIQWGNQNSHLKSKDKITAHVIELFLKSTFNITNNLKVFNTIIDQLLEAKFMDLNTLGREEDKGKLLVIKPHSRISGQIPKPRVTFPGFYMNDKETYLLQKFLEYEIPIHNRYYVDIKGEITMLEYFIIRNNFDAAKLLLNQDISIDIGILKIFQRYLNGFKYTQVVPFSPLANGVFYIYEPRVSALTLAILRCPGLVIPILNGGCKIERSDSEKWWVPVCIWEHLSKVEQGKLENAGGCDVTLARLCLGPEHEHVMEALESWSANWVPSLLSQCKRVILYNIMQGHDSLNQNMLQSLGLPSKLQDYLIS